MTLVPADLSLFGDDEPDQRDEPSSPAAAPIATWQVDLLRKALDARGLTTMTERQEAIETAIGRSVQSLRCLTQDEGLRGLSKLSESASPRSSAASVWDERDEDTWIDRL